MQVLLVGCSFVSNLRWDEFWSVSMPALNTDVRFCGSPGAGNVSLAARVIHECSQHHYDKVYVIWSGINRIDIPVSKQCHEIYGGDYRFYTVTGETVWYHSGGFGSIESNPHTTNWLQEYFSLQNKTATKSHLSDLSLLSILQTQNFLQCQNIPYRMSWIYDPHKSYDNLDHMLGVIDTSSHLYGLIDWHAMNSAPSALDFAMDQSAVSKDQFHPYMECMAEWFLRYLDLDIKAT